MYRNRFCTVLPLLAVLCFPFISCSSGSSGSDTPDIPPEIELPTMDTIVGSWSISGTTDIRDRKDYDRDKDEDEIIGQGTETVTISFDADTNFLTTHEERMDYIPGFYPDSHYYELHKGTFSIESGGILTLNIEYEAYPDSIEDPAAIDWIEAPSMESVSYAIIDNALYPCVFSRVGDGSGLVGTWEAFSSGQDSPADPIEYERTFLEITESSITEKVYYKDADDWVLDDEQIYAYAPRTATTITVTVEPGTAYAETYAAGCILDDDLLYIDYDDDRIVLTKDTGRHAAR